MGAAAPSGLKKRARLPHRQAGSVVLQHSPLTYSPLTKRLLHHLLQLLLQPIEIDRPAHDFAVAADEEEGGWGDDAVLGGQRAVHAAAGEEVPAAGVCLDERLGGGLVFIEV